VSGPGELTEGDVVPAGDLEMRETKLIMAAAITQTLVSASLHASSTRIAKPSAAASTMTKLSRRKQYRP
jgi:hypothetical protein